MLGQTLAKPEVRQCLQARVLRALTLRGHPWPAHAWAGRGEAEVRPACRPASCGHWCDQGVTIIYCRMDAATDNTENPWRFRCCPKWMIIRPHSRARAMEGFFHVHLARTSVARVLRAANADWRACGFGKPGNVGCRCMLFREYHSVHDGCADFSTSDSAVMRCSLRVRLAHR